MRQPFPCQFTRFGGSFLIIGNGAWLVMVGAWAGYHLKNQQGNIQRFYRSWQGELFLLMIMPFRQRERNAHNQKGETK
jgi:hypothetical protein